MNYISACCRGERNWAGGFRWKYENSELKKSKIYKKRTSTMKTERRASSANISKASSDRKWYNDGTKSFFLKDFQDKTNLVPGRLRTMKNKHQSY